MESSQSYLEHSTGLTTPTNEFGSQTASECIDVITGQHLEVKGKQTAKIQRQSLITDFFPQLKKVQSYVRMGARSVSTLKTYETDKIPFYFRLLSSNKEW